MKLQGIVQGLSQHKMTVTNFIVTIIEVVIEEIMEHEYTCPPLPWNQVYLAVFIGVPAIIFFILSYIFQAFILKSVDAGQNNCCNKMWHSFFPPGMWIVIVFLDGRYLQCALSTTHDASTEPTNVYVSIISKIVGFSLLLIITLVIFREFYKNKPEQRAVENEGMIEITERNTVPNLMGAQARSLLSDRS